MNPRYTTYDMIVGGRPMYYVVDSQDNGREVYRSREKSAVLGRAGTLNRQAAEAPAPAEAAAAPPTVQRPGWSNAAKRRAGHTASSHPLGEAVGGGPGYTVYRDTAFGGGDLQIWDES